MLDVVLYQPEIPPNTGNVIRLCAHTRARLHLLEPLGLSPDDRPLQRAGLDYHEMANVTVHRDWEACKRGLGSQRRFAFSRRGTKRYDQVRYEPDDVLVFGPETSGLSEATLGEFPAECRLRLPMRAGNRSINLSNAVAVVVFEAWRQHGFGGAEPA